MKNAVGTDRFMAAIVAAIIVIVATAFAVALRLPEPSFQAEDSPEAVVHNYLLAIRQQQYDRAYKYLAQDLPGYPDSEARFIADVNGCRWCFGMDSEPATMAVQTTSMADGRAWVRIRATTFHEGDLFGSSEYTSAFTMVAERQGGKWRLVRGESYWIDCWHDPEACLQRDPGYIRPPKVEPRA
jgi:hypothetical protein